MFIDSCFSGFLPQSLSCSQLGSCSGFLKGVKNTTFYYTTTQWLMSGTTVMQWDLCVHKCEEACVCVCGSGRKRRDGGSLTKKLVASVKPNSCMSEIRNWASHGFNGPERERETTEDIKSQCTDIETGTGSNTFLRRCRVPATTETQVQKRSECSQMSRAEEWNVLCWGGGGGR